MKSVEILCTFFLFFCVFTNDLSAYKILGVFPTLAPSHYSVGSALFKELARRGHEVTVIAPFSLKKPMKNFNEIITTKSLKAMEKIKVQPVERSDVMLTILLHQAGLQRTQMFLEEDGVQNLLKSNSTFDLVICEAIASEALYGLADHFGAPLIGLSAFGAYSWTNNMVGSPSPPSYVPYTLLSLTDRMSLVDRIVNLAFLTFERLLQDFYYLPKQEALYKKFFPNAKRDIYEVQRNTALVLLNQHVSLTFPRPYMPNHIEVGGIHINRQLNPLPDDIQKFIDEAEDDVIYFSMGSYMKCKDFPLEKLKTIMESLRGLKQRILWKFEDPNLPGKPDNVFISDWFPQSDILAHPKVKIFITHGGLLSTTESIYHGKPLIGIPVFGDQFLNMARAEAMGYGIMLSFKDLSVESIKKAIQKVGTETKYTEVAKAMSARYRDQPIEPLNLAVFWVEHVARNKGAKYLHCAGLDLNFFEYHNLDAILILLGGPTFILIVLVWFFKKVLRFFFRKKQIEKVKYN